MAAISASEPSAPVREAPELVKAKGGSGALPGFGGLREHWHQTSQGSNLHFFANAPGVGPSSGPVLMLAHGFPQTSYIFRYVVPALQGRMRLFVPDQPGIAHSTAARSGDKLTLGRCYVEALVAHYGAGTQVVLGGHDRGARVVQRLAVSRRDEFAAGIEVLAAVMLDIVPIAAQFASFAADPANAVRYFHWAFMPAGGDLPARMIAAYGGGRWCRDIHGFSVGSNEAGRRSLEADDAVDIYAAWYERDDTNQASIDDYAAAADQDHKAMLDDQASGRKIDVPTLVLHGAGLARMHDVAKVWPEYVASGTRLEVATPGEGYGHYLAEECPEWTIAQLEKFFDSLGL